MGRLAEEFARGIGQAVGEFLIGLVVCVAAVWGLAYFGDGGTAAGIGVGSVSLGVACAFACRQLDWPGAVVGLVSVAVGLLVPVGGVTAFEIAEERPVAAVVQGQERTGTTWGNVVDSGESGEDCTGVEVPDVVGQYQDDAEQALEEAGLELGALSEEETTQADPGVVRASGPEAGAVLEDGCAVDLVIAAPIDENGVVVPDLTGMTEAQASEALGAVGLTGSFTTEVNNEAAEGTVIAQTPAPAMEAAAGEVVAVTLAVPGDPGNGGTESPDDSDEVEENAVGGDGGTTDTGQE